jgi:hypothetical protein
VIESLPVPPPRTSDDRRLESSDRVRDLARLELRDGSRERSVARDLQRAYSAAQQLLLDRTELLVRDAREQLAAVARGALLTGLGGLVGLVGWLALMSAAVLWLRASLSLAESIAAVAAVHLTIASLLVWRGSRAIGSGG